MYMMHSSANAGAGHGRMPKSMEKHSSDHTDSHHTDIRVSLHGKR